MSMPKWNAWPPWPPMRGSLKKPRTGCWTPNGLIGHPYDERRGVVACVLGTTCSGADAAALVAVADGTLTLPAPATPMEARATIAVQVRARRRMDWTWTAGANGRRVCV